MKIVYIHGYESNVKESDPKYDVLSNLYVGGHEVLPIAPNYDLGYEHILQELKLHCKDVDLIVGTSMGGYSASIIGCLLNIPFVSLNPVLNPKNVKRGNLQGYPDFECSSNGIVFLNTDDEIINSYDSYEFFKGKQEVHLLEGGCHRFLNVNEIKNDIELFYESWLFLNEKDNGSLNL